LIFEEVWERVADVLIEKRGERLWKGREAGGDGAGYGESILEEGVLSEDTRLILTEKKFPPRKKGGVKVGGG